MRFRVREVMKRWSISQKLIECLTRFAPSDRAVVMGNLNVKDGERSFEGLDGPRGVPWVKAN